jgi:hypothetical protein
VSEPGGAAPGDGAVGVASDPPVGVRFQPVVPAAERAAVDLVGAAALVVRDAVIDVAPLGGPGAAGMPAGAIASHDQVAQRLTGPVPNAPKRLEMPLYGIQDERGPLGVGGQRPRDRGGDRPVAGQLGRVLGQPDRGRQVDEKADLERPALPGRRPTDSPAARNAGAAGVVRSVATGGEQVDQRVEPASAGGARVVGGLRGLRDCAEGLGNRVDRGGWAGGDQLRHRVGQVPHRHVAPRCGRGVPLGRGLRVDRGQDLADQPAELRVGLPISSGEHSDLHGGGHLFPGPVVLGLRRGAGDRGQRRLLMAGDARGGAGPQLQRDNPAVLVQSGQVDRGQQADVHNGQRRGAGQHCQNPGGGQPRGSRIQRVDAGRRIRRDPLQHPPLEHVFDTNRRLRQFAPGRDDLWTALQRQLTRAERSAFGHSAEDWLQVDDGRSVDGLQVAHLHSGALHTEDRDAVQTDRVGPVGRPGGEHAGLRAATVTSRVHDKHVAAGAVQPGDDKELRPDLETTETVRHLTVEDQPGVRRTFVTLQWGLVQVDERRLDDTDGPNHNLSVIHSSRVLITAPNSRAVTAPRPQTWRAVVPER